MRSRLVLLTLLPSLLGASTPAAAELPPDDATPDRDAPTATPASPPPLKWLFETGAASTYVFRGRLQYAARTDRSSQSTVAVTWNGAGPGALSLTTWNATALGHSSVQPGNAIEVDLTAAYALTVAKAVAMQVGYTSYLYPHAVRRQPIDGAHEAFVTVALARAGITPFVGVYPELVRMRGAYATTGLSRTFALRNDLSVVPQVSVGGAAYAGAPLHLNDVSAALLATFSLRGGAYVSARAAWSLMGGPAAQLPGADGSLVGRSLPWAMLAVGAQL